MTLHSPHAHWIITADGRQGALYSCRRTPGEHLHVDEARRIDNPHENEHEHHRPSVLGRGPSANAAQHFASFGHESEEERRRFARELAAWIGRAMGELGIEHLTVFAPARLLGVLRGEVGALKGRAELREAELTHLRAHELAEHRAILDAVKWSVVPSGS